MMTRRFTPWRFYTSAECASLVSYVLNRLIRSADVYNLHGAKCLVTIPNVLSNDGDFRSNQQAVKLCSIKNCEKFDDSAENISKIDSGSCITIYIKLILVYEAFY